MSEIAQNIIEKAKHIKLLALDVDGVMTDGRLFFSAQGDELKAFNILDGHGIKMLMNSGIKVAIITGRSSPLTARRARDLGIELILQGREDKKEALHELISELEINTDQIAYMGDDLPDLGAIATVGLGISVPNGSNFVKQHADFVTQTPGGQGAVREISELILDAQGLLKDIHQSYLPQS